MGQHLTYTTRLVFQEPEDYNKLWATLLAHRDAFNTASKLRYTKGSRNSIRELHSLFYHSYRDQYPEVPSQVLVRAEQECLSKYRSAKSNKHKLQAPIHKKKLSMRLDKRLYAWKNSRFNLTTLQGRISCELQLYDRLQTMLDSYEFCDPELFVKDNEVWIAITFDIPVLKAKEGSAIGVDLGIRMTAVTSEGRFYRDKKFNDEKRRLRYQKRQLQSKGTKSAKRHLKKLRRKEHNKNHNQAHKIANAILNDTDADIIVLEDLSKIKTKKHPNQNKNAISQVPFFLLKEILAYKAPLMRKTVITVNPTNTSQIDHRTGEKNGLRQGRRYYGKDGVVLDADHNASVNIANKGTQRTKHPISYQLILDGQAVVNQPKSLGLLVQG